MAEYEVVGIYMTYYNRGVLFENVLFIIYRVDKNDIIC